MSRQDPARQAEIDRFIAERGVTKLPTSAVGDGTAVLPEADRKAIAEHQRRLDERKAEMAGTHSQTRAKERREEEQASAARARKALNAGRAVVDRRPEQIAAIPLRKSAPPKPPTAPAPVPQPPQTRPPAAPAKRPEPVEARQSLEPSSSKSAPVCTKAAFDPGPRPTLGWLDVNLLDVDHSYQRALQPRHAKQLAAEFRWSDFQPVTVTALDNGRYAAIDGQHRLRAALSIPEIVDIPCYIIERATAQEQARTFLAINGSHHKVTALEKFRAGLLAGDKAITTVYRITQELGIRLVGAQAHTPMATKAVDRLLQLHKRHGVTALRSGLKALALAWPTESEAFASDFIMAVVAIFKRGPELTTGRAVEALQEISPTRFAADMHVAGKEQGRSGSSMVFLELHRRMLGREFKR